MLKRQGGKKRRSLQAIEQVLLRLMDLHACLPSERSFLATAEQIRQKALSNWLLLIKALEFVEKKSGMFPEPAWPAVSNDLLPILPTDLRSLLASLICKKIRRAFFFFLYYVLYVRAI